MTQIISHKARQISVNLDETFNEYAARVATKQVEVKHADITNEEGYIVQEGEFIEVDPGLEYSCLFLGMKRLLTEQEFGAVYVSIMTAITQMEAAGILPENLIEVVATPFDLLPPSCPERFMDEAEQYGDEIKLYLTGQLHYEFKKVMKETAPDAVGGEDESENHPDTPTDNTNTNETSQAT